jgi:hypothetical protein
MASECFFSFCKRRKKGKAGKMEFYGDFFTHALPVTKYKVEVAYVGVGITAGGNINFKYDTVTWCKATS